MSGNPADWIVFAETNCITRISEDVLDVVVGAYRRTSKQHRLEREQTHAAIPVIVIGGGLAVVRLPELCLVDNRQTGVHVEEVPPDKLVQYCSTRDTEAALYSEILDVLLGDIG